MAGCLFVLFMIFMFFLLLGALWEFVVSFLIPNTPYLLIPALIWLYCKINEDGSVDAWLKSLFETVSSLVRVRPRSAASESPSFTTGGRRPTQPGHSRRCRVTGLANCPEPCCREHRS